MGDLNGDGFLDFVASALAWDGLSGVAQGRIHILRSDNSPAPPPSPVGGGAAETLGGRTIELVASRERIRRRHPLRLRGRVEAFADLSACQSRQVVRASANPSGR
jgi:hypothetical protein